MMQGEVSRSGWMSLITTVRMTTRGTPSYGQIMCRCGSLPLSKVEGVIITKVVIFNMVAKVVENNNGNDDDHTFFKRHPDFPVPVGHL